MDGVGGTIKNLVFRAVKSEKIAVKTPEEFANAANEVVPSIQSLYMPIDDMLKEPAEVASAPAIPETLQVHKVVRKINKDNVPFIEFFKLSKDDKPAYTHCYRSEEDPQVCGHQDHSEINDNTCGHCLVTYNVEKETEEWLCCPLCKKWFHESCFHEF